MAIVTRNDIKRRLEMSIRAELCEYLKGSLSDDDVEEVLLNVARSFRYKEPSPAEDKKIGD